MMLRLKSIRQFITSKTPPPTPHSLWTNPVHYLACGFGIGCLTVMPGTFGTLVGVAVYLVIAPLSLSMMITITLLLNLWGIWLCGKTNKDWGYQDHPAACYDEIAAFPICLIGISPSLTHIVIAFILFRILDIAKPPPINWIDQHVHGGIGVMLDDIVAALITLAIMYALTTLTPL